MDSRALGLTVALHGLVVALALLPSHQPRPKPPARPMTASTVPPESTGTMAPVGADGKPCPKAYRGVGLKHSWGGMVIEVAAGGPADKAGIQIGDFLTNPEVLRRDEYPVGEVLFLRYERDGQARMATPRVALICEVQ